MKKIFQKFILVPTIFCALLVASNFVAPAVTHAAPVHTNVQASNLHPAVTCYSQATQVGPYKIIANDFVLKTTIVKGPYCNDINFESTQQAGPTQARVIFLNINTGAIIGYGSWKNINSVNTWYVLASSVLNGTHYTLEFKDPYTGTTFKGFQAS